VEKEKGKEGEEADLKLLDLESVLPEGEVRGSSVLSVVEESDLSGRVHGLSCEAREGGKGRSAWAGRVENELVRCERAERGRWR